MSENLQFIWIDDEPSREREVQNIEEATSTQVTFVDVKNKDLEKTLSGMLEKKPPDLVLMDHNLQNVATHVMKTGSSAAEIIREKWPSCPIVCITALPFHEIDLHKRNIYEAVFVFSQISDHYSTLESIAVSFRKIRNTQIKNVVTLLALLKTPKEDKTRISAILPEHLKEDFSDNSLPLRLSRWVRNTLMAKPGFLYDRLWTATLLGIKYESFGKVENLFEGAKYSGIFSTPDDERWWQSRLRMILSSIVDDTELIYPWEQGRKLPGVGEGDYSKCHRSSEDYPETVAYIDETTTIMKPMRLKYTVPHPQFQNSLFFEEMRVMKGSE